MQIAIAGTHRIGKTTLAEAFLGERPDFELEPEPYEQMLEAGEDFLDHYEAEAFIRQLRYLVGRLELRSSGDNVIFDRSPLDFLAYLAASEPRGGWHSLDPDVVQVAAAGLARLDLLAWLPLSARRDGAARSFRRSVDEYLGELLRSDPLSLLAESSLSVIEIEGSTAERLVALLGHVA